MFWLVVRFVIDTPYRYRNTINFTFQLPIIPFNNRIQVRNSWFLNGGISHRKDANLDLERTCARYFQNNAQVLVWNWNYCAARDRSWMQEMKKKMTTNTQIFLVNKRRPMNRKRHFHRTIRNQYGTFILDFVRVFMRMIVLLMKAPCISNLKKRGRRELGMVDVHRKSIARYRNAFSSDVKYIKCQ